MNMKLPLRRKFFRRLKRVAEDYTRERRGSSARVMRVEHIVRNHCAQRGLVDQPHNLPEKDRLGLADLAFLVRDSEQTPLCEIRGHLVDRRTGRAEMRDALFSLRDGLCRGRQAEVPNAVSGPMKRDQVPKADLAHVAHDLMLYFTRSKKTKTDISSLTRLSKIVYFELVKNGIMKEPVSQSRSLISRIFLRSD